VNFIQFFRNFITFISNSIIYFYIARINICLIFLILICNIFLYYILVYIQGVSRLVGITAGGDFLRLCDQKSSYKYVFDFGRLRSYDRLKLRREDKDY